jgi:predicted Zn-dependent protease
MDGQVHVDASERWTINPASPVAQDSLDLRYVLLHELGHALGLRHSNNPHAVMNPIYRRPTARAPTVSADDVMGMRQLYDRFITRQGARAVHGKVSMLMQKHSPW